MASATGDNPRSEPLEPAPAPVFRTAWWQRLLREGATYELTRFAVLRLLALVYLVAFASLAAQLDPLLGSRGLLPVTQLLESSHARLGAEAYWRLPNLFSGPVSWAPRTLSCAPPAGPGVALSALFALSGATNAVLQLALWLLYMSFVHVGQIFYGYGWEIQLLETGLIAVFMCPLRTFRPLPAAAAPVIPGPGFLRWLIFRIMLGAALIKLRNDPCWRNLTCLDFHFETQPNPNPLAWWLHHAAPWVHSVGVAFNHFVEIVVPWFAFGFRRWRHAAGLLLVSLQVVLIASGNLSFLNWLTIVPALACFDDTFFVRPRPGPVASRPPRALLRARALARPGTGHADLRRRGAAPQRGPRGQHRLPGPGDEPLVRSASDASRQHRIGAFGSVDRERYEVILEGTSAPFPDRDATKWLQYELPCMPGDPRRRPCLVTPYHYRLDWQMWFVGNGAARGENLEEEPWLVHLIWQLLNGEATPRPLLARDPFPAAPPRWIRAGIWRYRFSESRADGAWWTRQRVGEALPPLSAATEGLRRYVALYGWPDAPREPAVDPAP